MIFENRGLDAYKKVNGRKRHFLVDSGGRLWAVRVGAAHKADGGEACYLLKEKKEWQTRLKTILGDGAYDSYLMGEAYLRGKRRQKESSLMATSWDSGQVVERVVRDLYR